MTKIIDFYPPELRHLPADVRKAVIAAKASIDKRRQVTDRLYQIGIVVSISAFLLSLVLGSVTGPVFFLIALGAVGLFFSWVERSKPDESEVLLKELNRSR